MKCNNGTELATQSGLQASYGGYSTKFSPEERRSQRKGSSSSAQEVWTWAPLMTIYGLAIFAGVVIGFILGLELAPVQSLLRSINELVRKELPGGFPEVRLLVLGLISAAGSLLLILQMIIGFPFDRMMHRAIAEVNSDSYGKGVSEEDADLARGVGLAVLSQIEVRYTFWFWLAFLATLAPLVTVIIEWSWFRARAAPTQQTHALFCVFQHLRGAIVPLRATLRLVSAR
jgi:hypothetical protein